MRIAGSNRFFLNPNEEETLAFMAKNGSPVDDVEEGEISDDSIKEITEHDFKQESRVSKPKVENSSVWLQYPHYTPDLYNLAWAQAVQNKPLGEILARRDFGSVEISKGSAATTNVLERTSRDDNKREICRVLIDDSEDEVEESKVEEKEEGELEEGEIDLDSEVIDNSLDNSATNSTENESEKTEFEKRLNSVTEVLKCVTVEETEKSFGDVCLQIRMALDMLQQMVLGGRVLAVDNLVQQTFSGIHTIHSVFCGFNSKQQTDNKEAMLRVLSLVKNQDPALFSPGQMKEIVAMFQQSLVSHCESSSITVADGDKGISYSSGANSSSSLILVENSSKGLISSTKNLDPVSVHSVPQKNVRNGSEAVRVELPFNSKGRGLSPLLDLHVIHDEDSLPSPTRDNPAPLLTKRSQGLGEGPATHLATSELEETDDAALHPYVTDALKAVSSYQQKFGRSSFFLNNRLPSPTPSEECDDDDNDDDGDSHGEVSSSSTVGNVGIKTSIPLHLSVAMAAPCVATSAHAVATTAPYVVTSAHAVATTAPSIATSAPAVATTSAHVGGLIGPAGKTVGLLGSGSNPTLKAPNSRDPRLRCVNSDALDLNRHPVVIENNTPKTQSGGTVDSRKHRVEGDVPDSLTLKRPRNGLPESGASIDVPAMSGERGWLEQGGNPGPHNSNRDLLTQNMEIDAQKQENGEVVSEKGLDSGANISVSISGSKQLPLAGTGPVVSLPSLLKDIAVNPTILMHLIMEQQKLASEAQKKPAELVQPVINPSVSNILPGSVSSGNVSSTKTSEQEQRPEGNPQLPALDSNSERGKVRMKPRDPRRVLHNTIVQKSENSLPDQLRTNGALSSIIPGSKDDLTVREQNDQAEMSSLPSHSSPLPDIAPQFTTRLKNIADILSHPQMVQNFPQPVITKTGVRGVSDLNDQQSGTVVAREEGTVVSSQPQDQWGDLEHLFEGYDDQQKAAIQRERARRIEEQNKMFAARKLCLVLDLDHTLLNSAKFVEVDQVHDEILRKKEEQDREKPQRHLFRFPHMGMWTKLRPGIWNFLEKASKLYELHLYTMGNKLYATEMAKVLDPTGTLFAGRVISRGDDGDPFGGDERVPKSKDLDGVLGMESAVVIIDDSVRVWPHNRHNLIVVERYTYFPCSRRQFGLLGPSLLEIDHDERPEDGTLASSLAVIERLHHIFFSHHSLNDVDVRNILASEQRKILSGCRIVFSRVFPVGEANPHLHPLWQTAEQFGAICTNQLDDQVTHVVANSLGTDKVNWALSTGKFVVHPGWVEASALLYRRANERDFAVK